MWNNAIIATDMEQIQQLSPILWNYTVLILHSCSELIWHSGWLDHEMLGLLMPESFKIPQSDTQIIIWRYKISKRSILQPKSSKIKQIILKMTHGIPKLVESPSQLHHAVHMQANKWYFTVRQTGRLLKKRLQMALKIHILVNLELLQYITQ